ncbi:RdgB/HAM1 family non-canonical purine NTP pyrophosphatase [Oxalobacter aliiformigenes]|mgnify:FL=1|uniref:dITP/XTP pyrophosphatase n=1 Tax=Oxalobacter aliiformigenes TaxID=2946593 RepID=A0ABY7JJS0_9BURK|nr:RdgB/HAM1 family non-canonical purine NTP pyrophosphatase [Oxalobacter aliiformigenes]WAV92815.1 RdgB/HAM1 family non-canonical purine NTP pyrophosphatase [Oxalobacter aliiformigenes]WAV95680.1 RdgB/HAM1 family non-canonical purine NTP pyrophosphatase [Oxalobacter aliiformigenes]WAV96525.1 RdgB/HAM1 family non-canonical purine NTP pyrophosphatase [Oxalobacter aliiformigenes]
MPKEIVLASGNPGKLKEFRQMLEPAGYRVVPQSDYHVSEADEPYFTFIENALTKARHVSRLTGKPALADDSGLCVNVLEGKPGVLSARYAGEPKSDDRNNARLIADLAGLPDKTANYYCVLVYVRSADDPQPVIADGRWFGRIVDTPRGANGFGYDPYFWIPEFGKTAAELTPDEKNSHSHRGMALRALLEKLP